MAISERGEFSVAPADLWSPTLSREGEGQGKNKTKQLGLWDMAVRSDQRAELSAASPTLFAKLILENSRPRAAVHSRTERKGPEKALGPGK